MTSTVVSGRVDAAPRWTVRTRRCRRRAAPRWPAARGAVASVWDRACRFVPSRPVCRAPSRMHSAAVERGGEAPDRPGFDAGVIRVVRPLPGPGRGQGRRGPRRGPACAHAGDGKLPARQRAPLPASVTGPDGSSAILNVSTRCGVSPARTGSLHRRQARAAGRPRPWSGPRATATAGRVCRVASRPECPGSRGQRTSWRRAEVGALRGGPTRRPARGVAGRGRAAHEVGEGALLRGEQTVLTDGEHG